MYFASQNSKGLDLQILDNSNTYESSPFSNMLLTRSTFCPSQPARKSKKTARAVRAMQTHPFRFVPTFRGGEISRFLHLRIRLSSIWTQPLNISFLKCQHLSKIMKGNNLRSALISMSPLNESLSSSCFLFHKSFIRRKRKKKTLTVM